MHSHLALIVSLVATCSASLASLEPRQAQACPFTPIQGCDISAKDPPPSTLICNKKGTVSSPDAIIGNTPCFASDLETCRDNCYQIKGCETFAFDAPMANCYLYGKTIKTMGFKPAPKSTSELRFWNKHCFTSYPCAVGGGKVYDPGFESVTPISNHTGDPINSWEYYSYNGGVCTKSGTAVHSGAKAAQCTIPSGGSIVLNQQLPSLYMAKTYSVNLWFAGKLSGSTPSVTCDLSVANIHMATFSPCSSASDPGCLDDGSAPVFRQTKNVTFVLEVPAALALICNATASTGSGGAQVYFDDVSLMLDNTYPSYPSPAACWVGEIHSFCDGIQTGCTPDGTLVTCDDSENTSPGPQPGEAMIFANECGPALGYNHSCHCVNGISRC